MHRAGSVGSGGKQSFHGASSWNLVIPPSQPHESVHQPGSSTKTCLQSFYWSLITRHDWLSQWPHDWTQSLPLPHSLEVRLAQSSNLLIMWSFWRPVAILKLSRGPACVASLAYQRHSCLRKFQAFLRLCQKLRTKTRYMLYYSTQTKLYLQFFSSCSVNFTVFLISGDNDRFPKRVRDPRHIIGKDLRKSLFWNR